VSHFFRVVAVPAGLCAALVVLAGCSDQYKGRSAISGKVQLKGQPIKEGSISFEPLEGQDTRGGAPISNGAYEIPRPNGLKPGKYLVRVTAGDGKTPADDEAAGPGGNTNIVSKDLVPPEWNVRSKQEVTVKADEPNKFDFDIK
jgi:hypothetical protein